jgi:serine/threonine-protein kinase
LAVIYGYRDRFGGEQKGNDKQMKVLANHRWFVLLLGFALLAWSFLPGSGRLESWLYLNLATLMPETHVPVKTMVATLGFENEQAGFSYAQLATLLDKLKSSGVAAIGLTLPLDHSQTLLDDVSRSRLKQALSKKKDAAILNQLDPDAVLKTALAASDRIILAMPATAGNTQHHSVPASLAPLSLEAPDNNLALMLPLLSKELLPELLPAKVMPRVKAAPLPLFTKSVIPALLIGAETGVVVSTPLALPWGEDYFPSFELALASRALGVPMNALTAHPGKGVTLGTAWYATDAGLRVYPRVQTGLMPVLTAQDILSGKVQKRQLRGKAVVVGLHTDLQHQNLHLPNGKMISPLEWTALSVNSLMNESFVSVPYWSLAVQRGTLMVIMLYLLLAPAHLRGQLGLMIGGGLAFLLLNGSLLMLLLQNTWLPLALPILFLLLGQGLVWLHQRILNHHIAMRDERDAALVELAANLRFQGQLDKAFAKLKQCAGNKPVLEALYESGLEFERRRQFAKALLAYDRIAEQDSHYRDIRERRARHAQKPEPNLATTTVSYASTALVVDDPKVERPVLGRYEIERELGRGAMGTVYLGRDPRIGRTVAIKTLALTEEFESTQISEVRRRFFQEAETAGRLNHPNIVTIYDVGEEHDLAYIAMDYIVGDSLDQHIREDELLPIEGVFGIGIQVAEALDYAHEQKVVHRDVKPGNIIYDLEKGQLKVTDFGIACLTDNSKTKTGTVLGSPFYMSPEQIAGKRVDGRSDLFSLGVTLYQLFSGRLPFEGDSLTSLMYQITHEKPKGIRKLRPELPACLTRLINKALEKNPAKRYASGQAMADAIQRCAKQSGMG